MEKAIKAQQVAEILGIDVKTVYQWARTGVIPATYVGGLPTKPGERKPVVFYLSKIEKHIKDNSTGE